jgi:ADP-ribosyl-[dinitrogen reductase] hydrolase
MSSHNPKFEAAHEGALVADALAMPVHWYYDRSALRREYGAITKFVAPQAFHSGSILFRSSYRALNERGDILREQAAYWGKPGVHYHQFLAAGENTLNYKLAAELKRFCTERGGYNPDAWLERYVACMLQPGWHKDTYVEEYHRAFFTHYSQGTPLRKCGIEDEHIGGLATVPALIAALAGAALPELRATVKLHVGLTHMHEGVQRAADSLTLVLFAMSAGEPLREAMAAHATDWISPTNAQKWSERENDEQVIGQRFSPACYIEDAMRASMYLAWKYHDAFADGVIANAMVGGDNCHRGAVVGSLLAANCSDWGKQRTSFGALAA